MRRRFTFGMTRDLAAEELKLVMDRGCVDG